jgi:hypothetical protein
MICEECNSRVFDLWNHNDKMTCWKCKPTLANGNFVMTDDNIFCKQNKATVNVENLIVIIKEF